MLYDCVPSKTLIATSEKVTAFRDAPAVGVCSSATSEVTVQLAVVNERVRRLAASQSADIAGRLASHGVRVLAGRARFAADQRGRTFALDVSPTGERPVERIEADVVLLATGGTPRVLPGAEPDGERILSWRQLYDLTELPDHLIVVGSGVTGAEFASGYTEMGVPVTWCPAARRCCPARIRRPPTSSRRCSPSAAAP